MQPSILVPLLKDVARKVATARKAADGLAKYWSGSPQSERLLNEAVENLIRAEGALTRAVVKL